LKLSIFKREINLDKILEKVGKNGQDGQKKVKNDKSGQKLKWAKITKMDKNGQY